MKKIKGLLYCTKAKPKLYKQFSRYDDEGKMQGVVYHCVKGLGGFTLNGTIPCECDFGVEEIYYLSWMNEKLRERILKQSCLTDKQFSDYIGNKDTCYTLHITNLNVFDKSRELSDYYKFDGIYSDINNWKTIDKAPQNMMYAYDLTSELGLSGTYNMYLKKNILISIKPEELCRILNGEQTILIKKQVLNCMKGNE